MEFLSVSASLVGLLAAGASIVSSIQSLKETPSFVRGVITEVESITACVRQLQWYLDGVTVVSRSRTSLVLVEQVQVVLTSCITTFSQLTRTLDKLGLTQPQQLPKRIKWTLKEQSISTLLLRLQGSRVSLNLMLTTLSCLTMDEAPKCSRELQNLVTKTLESNEEIARRLESLQTQTVAPSIDPETRTITQRGIDNETVQSEVLVDSHMDTVAAFRATSASFAFDRDLQSTRVYGRIAHRHSSFSVPSSTGQTRGWSFLSELTLSDVSNISIVSLPISVTELYDGELYESYHPDRQAYDMRHRNSRNSYIVEVVDRYTVSSIDIEETAALWPPDRVKVWMYETYLDRSILEEFLEGDELTGYAIALLQFKDLANVILHLPQRRRLWGEIQRLQTCIVDETLRLGVRGQSSSRTLTPQTTAPQTAYDEEDLSEEDMLEEHIAESVEINQAHWGGPNHTKADVQQSTTASKNEHSDAASEANLQQTVQTIHGSISDWLSHVEAGSSNVEQHLMKPITSIQNPTTRNSYDVPKIRLDATRLKRGFALRREIREVPRSSVNIVHMVK